MARMRTYLRPHKNNAPDALQYTPSFSGADTNWQLFHGPGGTAPSPTQNTEEGIAVEIVFEGRDKCSDQEAIALAGKIPEKIARFINRQPVRRVVFLNYRTLAA